MITSLDQTPSKFVAGYKKTLAEKGSESVLIAGSTDKQMILEIFSIILVGKFSLIFIFTNYQLIYDSKTSKSVLAVSFPSNFVISANEKPHRNNKREALSMLKNVVILYIVEQRIPLSLDFDYPALLIMDDFKD